MNLEEESNREILEEAKKEKRFTFYNLAAMRIAPHLIEDDEFYVWACDENLVHHAIKVTNLYWENGFDILEYNYKKIAVNHEEAYAGELVSPEGEFGHLTIGLGKTIKLEMDRLEQALKREYEFHVSNVDRIMDAIVYGEPVYDADTWAVKLCFEEMDAELRCETAMTE